MTPDDLQALLATMLTGLAGEYRTKTGRTYPAVRVGEPPGTWTPHGLEVRIDAIPDLRQVPAYGRGALLETHQVRLVNHGGDPAHAYAALRRILSRWPDAQARAIPANERLGVLSQHTITIPA